jgi:outer membrane immunogenic protein
MICVTGNSAAAVRGRRGLAWRGRHLRARLAALALILLAPAGAAAQSWDDDFLRGSFRDSASTGRWEGFNVGVHVGMSNMNTDFGNSTSSLVAFILRNTTLENEAQPSAWAALPSTTTNSKQYGVFLGYNMQWEQLVVGLDLAYNRVSSLETSASDNINREVNTSDGFINDVTIVAQSSLKLIDYGTIRARAGYTFGQFLPYAMLGGAVGRFNYATTATVTAFGLNPTTLQFYGPVTETRSNNKDGAIVGGFLAGLGVDVAILPNMFMRAEWEFIAFAPVNGIRANINTGRVGIGMKF